MASRGPIGVLRVVVPNVVKIGQAVTEISRFIDFSKMAAVRRWTRAWTTDEQYSAVFIALQNLVGIGAVVSIIWLL